MTATCSIRIMLRGDAKHRLVAFMLVPSLAFSTVPAQAQTEKERIAELEARVATQDALIQSLSERLDALVSSRIASEGKAVVPSEPSHPDPPKQAEITTSDGVTIKPRGRIQIDALLVNSGDGATPTGTQVRRFQLGAEGQIGGGFRYSAEASFAGGRLGLEDVLIAYRASEHDEILVGYFKPSITADDMTSDNFTLLLERSAYASIFAPGRRIGIGINHFGSSWGLRASVSGERDDSALDVGRQEAMVAAVRVHANLLRGGSEILHVAGSSYYARSSSTDRTFSLSQKPEANRALTVLNTGNFAARSGLFLGAEVGFQHGPFIVQIEGGTLGFAGDQVGDPSFWGWSAQASWRLTGESRGYDPMSGTFGRVTPISPLGSGGLGAVELGLRAGSVDLDDALVDGGRMTTLGGVINWYPLKHTRFGANIIHASIERTGLQDQHQILVTMRAAVDW